MSSQLGCTCQCACTIPSGTRPGHHKHVSRLSMEQISTKNIRDCANRLLNPVIAAPKWPSTGAFALLISRLTDICDLRKTCPSQLPTMKMKTPGRRNCGVKRTTAPSLNVIHNVDSIRFLTCIGRGPSTRKRLRS